MIQNKKFIRTIALITVVATSGCTWLNPQDTGLAEDHPLAVALNALDSVLNYSQNIEITAAQNWAKTVITYDYQYDLTSPTAGKVEVTVDTNVSEEVTLKATLHDDGITYYEDKNGIWYKYESPFNLTCSFSDIILDQEVETTTITVAGYDFNTYHAHLNDPFSSVYLYHHFADAFNAVGIPKEYLYDYYDLIEISVFMTETNQIRSIDMDLTEAIEAAEGEDTNTTECTISIDYNYSPVSVTVPVYVATLALEETPVLPYYLVDDIVATRYVTPKTKYIKAIDAAYDMYYFYDYTLPDHGQWNITTEETSTMGYSSIEQMLFDGDEVYILVNSYEPERTSDVIVYDRQDLTQKRQFNLGMYVIEMYLTDGYLFTFGYDSNENYEYNTFTLDGVHQDKYTEIYYNFDWVKWGESNSFFANDGYTMYRLDVSMEGDISNTSLGQLANGDYLNPFIPVSLGDYLMTNSGEIVDPIQLTLVHEYKFGSWSPRKATYDSEGKHYYVAVKNAIYVFHSETLLFERAIGVGGTIVAMDYANGKLYVGASMTNGRYELFVYDR